MMKKCMTCKKITRKEERGVIVKDTKLFHQCISGQLHSICEFLPSPTSTYWILHPSPPLILSSTSVRIVLHLIINHLANHALRSWRSFTELIHKIVLTNFNVMGIEDNLTILVWWWISFKSELLLNFRISFSCNSHYKMKSKGCTTHLSKLWMKWHDSGGPHICSMVRSGPVRLSVLLKLFWWWPVSSMLLFQWIVIRI